MRAHYDFANMKGEKNPYSKQLKQPVTILHDKASVEYFKKRAAELGMPYQNLINLLARLRAESEEAEAHMGVLRGSGDRQVFNKKQEI